MIKEFFKDLTQLDGVDGITLISKDNRLIDSWEAPNFESKIFNEIGINYCQIFVLLGRSERDYNELVIQHEKGQIYARQFPELFLLIVTRLKVDVALLRIAVSVVIPDLLNSKKLQKILKKLPKESRNYLTRNYLDETEQAYYKKIKLV
jgi:predicted regulator of Ras-like GTPase activity (Roadblock/LC7/MglB family)